jgi:hypothetical protein
VHRYPHLSVFHTLDVAASKAELVPRIDETAGIVQSTIWSPAEGDLERPPFGGYCPRVIPERWLLAIATEQSPCGVSDSPFEVVRHPIVVILCLPEWVIPFPKRAPFTFKFVAEDELPLLACLQARMKVGFLRCVRIYQFEAPWQRPALTGGIDTA